MDNQIGCGYCKHELTCKIRDPRVNKAKQGCPDWQHFNKKQNQSKNGK